MRKLVVGLVVLTASGLIHAAPADAATREVVFDVHMDVHDTIADCGSFTVVDHAVADITGTVYFDHDGNPDRFRVRIQGTDTLTSSDGGPSYSSPNVLTYTEETERALKTGVAFQVTVPHYGRVFSDVGAIRFDETGITATGIHDALSGDTAALCAAFA